MSNPTVVHPVVMQQLENFIEAGLLQAGRKTIVIEYILGVKHPRNLSDIIYKGKQLPEADYQHRVKLVGLIRCLIEMQTNLNKYNR